MNLKFLPLIFPLMGICSAAFAVKMEVEDISNRLVTCDSSMPFLIDKPIGTCLAVPNNTLQLRLSLEPGDKAEDLESTHIVLQDKGEYFQYNTGGKDGGWRNIGVNEFATGVTRAAFCSAVSAMKHWSKRICHGCYPATRFFFTHAI